MSPNRVIKTTLGNTVAMMWKVMNNGEFGSISITIRLRTIPAIKEAKDAFTGMSKLYS